MLDVDTLVAGYGDTTAVSDVSFRVGRGEFVTLLGPSGCGKTTTLRCVAGLHRVDSGDIVIGRDLVASSDVHVPPNERDINMVFQSYAVWPHMTVFDNVAYGLRVKRMGRAELRERVGTMLELVGLSAYEKRYATELSGGQQQRVALARALAPHPGLVLMDEPLSNLDARLRARMRNEIREIQELTGTTVLYVTHDQEEALSMSDRILVMKDGVVMQEGAPWELYNWPRNRFVADFLGEANCTEAVVLDVSEADHFVARSVDFAEGTVLRVPIRDGQQRPTMDDTVNVVFRPEWVQVGSAPHGGSTIAVSLERQEFLGSQTECTFRSGAGRLRVGLSSAEVRRQGDLHEVTQVSVPSDNLVWFS